MQYTAKVLRDKFGQPFDSILQLGFSKDGSVISNDLSEQASSIEIGLWWHLYICTKTITVKRKRAVWIVHAESDDCDHSFHARCLLEA